MSQKLRQWVINSVFAGMLGVVWYLGHQPRASAALNSSDAMRKFGFALTEQSHKAGLDFVHTSPRLDTKLAHILPEIAAMGAAVSVADFDNDGWDDLYVCNSGEGSRNSLFRNLGDGRFQDVARSVGLADMNQPESGVSMGSVWGDYDNDGDEDLLLYRWGQPQLFRNEGGKAFVPVADTGLPAWCNANAATWLDYDRDGKLDLFLAGYYREGLNLWQLASTRIMPDSFEYAENGGRKYLLRNMGNGRFRDVTEELGLRSRRWALAVVAADLRGTGYPDLFIANDYGVSEFWTNQAGRGFVEQGRRIGIAERPKSGMNTAVADIRNSGEFSVYVSNITDAPILVQGNNLWSPRSGTRGTSLRYVEEAESLGIQNGGWSFGAQFGDLNNDGWNDLFLTNGFISAGEGSYWHDFGFVALGSRGIIEDAQNWPRIGDRSHSGNQRKCLWINVRGERFVDVAAQVGVTEVFDGRSVALADFSNHGALDVAVAHQRGPLLLYRNEVDPSHNWVQFQLEGTRSNRSAIGAQVRVFWNGMQQVQEVLGASGFCAQNSRRLHFGLGAESSLERVVIRWPSGREQVIHAPQVNRLNRVKEPES